jgi:hypothetical protein
MTHKEVFQQVLQTLWSVDVPMTPQVAEAIELLNREIAKLQPLSYDEIVKLNKCSHNVWDSVLFARQIEQAHGIK